MAVGAERGQPPYKATDTEDRSCTDHTDGDQPLQFTTLRSSLHSREATCFLSCFQSNLLPHTKDNVYKDPGHTPGNSRESSHLRLLKQKKKAAKSTIF